MITKGKIKFDVHPAGSIENTEDIDYWIFSIALNGVDYQFTPVTEQELYDLDTDMINHLRSRGRI